MRIPVFSGRKQHPNTRVWGVLLVVLVLISSLCFSGCEDTKAMRAYYAKENAGKRAFVYLVSYTQKHNIPLQGFEGPYFDEVVGLDYPVYTVCYTHPVYFFCYDDHAKQTFVDLVRDIDSENALYKYINQQNAIRREPLKNH